MAIFRDGGRRHLEFLQFEIFNGWDAILDLQNFKFLTIGTVKRFEMHHRAKFRQNRLNRDRVMAILIFSRWWPPPSWNF